MTFIQAQMSLIKIIDVGIRRRYIPKWVREFRSASVCLDCRFSLSNSSGDRSSGPLL